MLKYDDMTEFKIAEGMEDKCKEILLRKRFFDSSELLNALNGFAWRDALYSIVNNIDEIDLRISVKDFISSLMEQVEPLARAELIDEILNEDRF